jgi:phospholipase/carboxylesterase
MSDIPDDEAHYLRAVLDASRVARNFLAWMETVAEQLAPQRSAILAAETERVHRAALHSARAALTAAPPPDPLAAFARGVDEALQHAERACELFTSFPTVEAQQRIPYILGALHEVAQAQEGFYFFRRALPPFADYFQLPGVTIDDRPALRGDAGAPATGVVHVSAGGHHGGFALYVPEHYTPERAWPLIVALHGGSGNGRDFLWTWVREARSLGYLLVAPSAVIDTWGEVEDQGLLEILDWLSQRYHVAIDRILLTGLSDGATFTLLYGLAHPEIYRALAPLCGVLHPANEPIGNLGRARDVSIYLVHGALDFLFPVQLARLARERLTAAGAALEYRELPHLSHTYPRSENVRILEWFASLPPR